MYINIVLLSWTDCQIRRNCRNMVIQTRILLLYHMTVVKYVIRKVEQLESQKHFACSFEDILLCIALWMLVGQWTRDNVDNYCSIITWQMSNRGHSWEQNLIVQFDIWVHCVRATPNFKMVRCAGIRFLCEGHPKDAIKKSIIFTIYYSSTEYNSISGRYHGYRRQMKITRQRRCQKNFALIHFAFLLLLLRDLAFHVEGGS